MDAKKTISEFVKKLKIRYRFIVYNDSTYQMLWSSKLTRLRIFTTVISFMLLLVFLIALIVGYTPVRELIPGYPSKAVRQMMVRNAMLADSLEEQIRIRDEYFGRFRTIIQGEIPEDPQQEPDTVTQQPVTIELNTYNHDSIFEQSLLEEKLNLSVQKGDIRQSSVANIHFFTPLHGMISQKFDKMTDHYAVDVVGLPNSRISSVLSGTVIFSGWTVETGYVIYIQHENNLVSVYKHNSEVLKKVGDFVKAGEVIAFMGNTGELTTGPHLHFELWFKGTPLDPEQYIDF